MDAVKFRIAVRYDKKAKVWWISSCSVPGLSLEDDDPWALIRRAAKEAPGLLRVNAASQ